MGEVKIYWYHSDKLTRDIIPDYAPNQIDSKVFANGSTLSDDLQNRIRYNQVKMNGKNVTATKEYTYESINFNFNNIKIASSIEVPVYGYKTLNYHVTVNGRDVPYTISNLGFIKVDNIKKIKNVKIEYLYPKMYKYIIYFSTIIILILSGASIFYFRNMK